MVKQSPSEGDSVRAQGLGLRPLSPVDDLKSAESSAILALEEAFANPRIRNIAITGPYGVGKSSVIASFVKQQDKPDRFIPIGVSAIADPDRESQQNFSLEREISKQILNFNPSGKIGHPGRALRRSTRTEQFRDALLFALMVFVMLLLLVLVRLGPFATHAPDIAEYAIIALGVITIALAGAQFLSSKQLSTKVSAGFAEVDVNPIQRSSFDEYSTELVTFFQNRPESVIIFEDLDRFNDPSIFDRLHDLNTLLNSAVGVINGTVKREPIRFLYAMCESIFDVSQGSSDQLSGKPLTFENSNESPCRKTKFFDVVIPILPQVNRGNSFGTLISTAHDAGLKINYKLLAFVADYVVDRRLITSIFNEYLILRQSFVFPKRIKQDPQAIEDNAFALVCYKNLFPRDFELGQFAESTLDLLHHTHNKLQMEKFVASLTPDVHPDRDILEAVGQIRRHIRRQLADKNIPNDVTKFKLDRYEFDWEEDNGQIRYRRLAYGEKSEWAEVDSLRPLRISPPKLTEPITVFFNDHDAIEIPSLDSSWSSWDKLLQEMERRFLTPTYYPKYDPQLIDLEREDYYQRTSFYIQPDYDVREAVIQLHQYIKVSYATEISLMRSLNSG